MEGKGKFHSITCYKGKKKGEGGARGIATFSLTSVLDRGGWSKKHPSCFTPEKSPGTHCVGG